MKERPWKDIDKWLSEVDPDDLGPLVQNYILESVYQDGYHWSGFSTQEMASIQKFLSDIILYQENLCDDI